VLVRTRDGARYRVDDDYEVIFSRTADEIAVRSDLAHGLDSLERVVAGGVMAIASTLRGRSCLHATTVAVDGSAVAVLGPVGAGKTTTAGLLIATGAALIGDDVLAPIEHDGGFVAPRGLLELRFRDSADSLARSIEARSVRRTSDGRVGVVPSALVAHDTTRLACFVVPRLVSGPAGVTLRELSAAETFRVLTASPRLEGWRQPEIVEQEFDLVARLTNAVLVAELTIGGADSLSHASAVAVRNAIQPYLGASGIASARAS
jgi:hypothetical protein